MKNHTVNTSSGIVNPGIFHRRNFPMVRPAMPFGLTYQTQFPFYEPTHICLSDLLYM